MLLCVLDSYQHHSRILCNTVAHAVEHTVDTVQHWIKYKTMDTTKTVFILTQRFETLNQNENRFRSVHCFVLYKITQW